MESNQSNNTPSEAAVIEALRLSCEVNSDGTKIYRNKEGRYHRIHGPAIEYTDGTQFWYKDGMLHREEGHAMVYIDSRHNEYCLFGKILDVNEFIECKKKMGIFTNYDAQV